MPPAMNQLREAVSIPVESRMSPRTPRRSSRSPQTEHKPNAMNPAYMLTMARPIASNLSAVPSDASPQLRPSCTRALNRAADAPAHPLAISGAGPGLQLPGRTGEPVGRPGSASPPTDNGFELRLCRRSRCCRWSALRRAHALWRHGRADEELFRHDGRPMAIRRVQ